ncbi:hypothetical protein PILCRDRAFT_816351 [Piloderma croceum F 1598]|uniref:Protein kinase domain-containing protein n=1 Tax=Piloderma croceum (strain F 1598) TaxID=765440 RepID=A0A0C3FQI9_PILCF|nr:hypothetical protein PILCRDRAFT_816351 [Piloderma croceum F 1598]
MSPELNVLTGVVRKTQSSYFTCGPLSEIWVGEWSRGRSKSKVAVKVIRGDASSMANDFTELDMKLLQEARIWSKLNHPNIAPFYGVYYGIGRKFAPCLVSPYFQHGDVEQYLKRNPDADRMKLVSEVVDGVEYLHENGFIHGDIKSKNILINDEGNACITDFGLTRKLEVTTEFVGGTIRWMAKELFPSEYDGGSEPRLITEASDTWAVGMTALEILAGKMPFYWLSESTVISHVRDGGRPSYQRYPRIEQDVWQVLERCWHEYPAQRPPMSSLCVFFRRN